MPSDSPQHWPQPVVTPIWSSTDALPIPGRGIADRLLPKEMDDDEASLDPDSVLDLESYLCSVATTADVSPSSSVALDVLADYLNDCESQLTDHLNALINAFFNTHSRPLLVAVDLPSHHQGIVCEYLIR